MTSESVVLNGTPAEVYDRLTHPGELEDLLNKAIAKAREDGKDVPAEIEGNLDKISFTDDAITFRGVPTGPMTLRRGDCSENADVQYVGEGTPVAVTIDFNLKPEGIGNCLLSINLQADIPFMLRMMIQKPLQQGLDTFAGLLRQIPSWHR